MKCKLQWLTALVIIILTGACSKNEFKIEFYLDSSVSANYEISYYATAKSGGLTIQAVAPVMEGRYDLKGVTRLPTLVYINSRFWDLPLIVYAEKGENIKITGMSSNPLDWEVSGNEINRQLSEWRKNESDSLATASPANVNRAVERFITDHPSDPVSSILLLCYFNRTEDEKTYINLWASLEGEARELRWVKLVSRADQPDGVPARPARLYSMAMRNINGKASTLSPKSMRASLLYFWDTSHSERKSYIDSLKKLSGEFPDSTIRIISDICLEADSLAWRNTTRRDSLKTVERLWTPQGVADIQLMKLGISRSPMVIIVDSTGIQRYRGTNISEAMNLFRSMMDTTSNNK